jgi:PAS domain S-box-containing protein
MASTLSLDIEVIFQRLPGNYLLLAPDNTILEVSDEYLASTLKRREDLLGASVQDAYAANEHREWQAELVASLEQVRQTHKPHTVLLPCYDLADSSAHAGGLADWHWEVTHYPLLSADGSLRYILHQTKDTKPERPLQSIKREAAGGQEQVRLALQSLPVMAWSMLPDGQADYFNQRWLRFTGRPATQAAGLNWMTDIHPDDCEKVTQAWQQSLASLESADLEYRLRHADGQYRWVLAQVAPRPDADGNVTRWTACATDIQDQKDRQAQLRAALEAEAALAVEQANHAKQLAEVRLLSLYTLLLQVPAMIAIVRGPQHVFEFVNPAYQDLYPDRHMLGRTVAETIPEAVERGLGALLDGVYYTGEAFVGKERMLPNRSSGPASQRYVIFSQQPFRENGKTVGVSILGYDVTELVLARKKAELLLNGSGTL